MALRAAVCISSSQRHNCSGNRLPRPTHPRLCVPQDDLVAGPRAHSDSEQCICMPSLRVKTNLLLYHLPIHSGIATRLSIVKHLTSPFSRPRVTAVNSSLKQAPYSYLPNIDSLKEEELWQLPPPPPTMTTEIRSCLSSSNCSVPSPLIFDRGNPLPDGY